MAQSIQISVVFPLFFAISLGRNDDLHPDGHGIGNDFVRIITPISQKCICGYPLDQMESFLAISSGTLCKLNILPQALRSPCMLTLLLL